MLGDSGLWGQIPHGFKKIIGPGNSRLLVKNGFADVITPAVCLNLDEFPIADEYQGRSNLRRLRLTDGGSALIRSYRHGGLLRELTRDLYFTRPARPFRELNITEELRRRGVSTVEVCGAGIELVGDLFYRGCLITRELVGSRDGWAWLQAEEGAVSRDAGLRSIAESVRRLHQQGVYHADLNLKNLLVRDEAQGMKTYIIDFDRATLFLGPLPIELARKNLNRLHRSVRKLDAARQYFPEPRWQRFLEFYYDDNGN